MNQYIGPISGQATPDVSTPTPLSSYRKSQIIPEIKHFSKVNPNLLIQWQGQSLTNDVLCGTGILKVSQRAKDITKKGNLVFSLEAQKWQNNRPEGEIKMISYYYFEQKSPNGIIKQVRRYDGGCHGLSKHGKGEYTIEYHYSNLSKQTIKIKGQWFNDILKSCAIQKDGKYKQNINMVNNIEMDNQRLTLTRKTLTPLNLQNDSPNIPKQPIKKRQSNYLQPPIKGLKK